MLKIFMTGDNHIGLKYASHEKSSQLIRARISAFDGMVQAANDENCNLFVITGDLFENTYGIAKKDIKNIIDKLSAFKGTVVVLPGNHDYYGKEVKIWQDFKEVMGTKDNIMLLTDFRPYAINENGEEVVMYPALCMSRHSTACENNLGWIKNQDIPIDTAYRIGIAHGAVKGETIDNEGQYFLMSREELESIPVDAWLVGHTHVPFPRNLKTDEYTVGERIFNAGTHVQTDVSCDTEGCAFIIEISSDKTVCAKKVLTGNIRFFRKEIELTAGNMENILKRELAEIPDNSVVDLILTGAVTAYEYENRSKFIEDSLSRFIEGTYDDYAMTKLISKELIEREFPETSFSAKLLVNLLNEPKEAQLAYELLKTLKEGK